jgi:hypothetical protein
MPRSAEILWNMLKNRRLVRKDLPFQNALLIAISFAVIAFRFSEEEELKRQSKQSASRATATTNAPRPHQNIQDRKNYSISGFTERICRSFWGGHHTLHDAQLDQALQVETMPVLLDNDRNSD